MLGAWYQRNSNGYTHIFRVAQHNEARVKLVGFRNLLETEKFVTPAPGKAMYLMNKVWYRRKSNGHTHIFGVAQHCEAKVKLVGFRKRLEMEKLSLQHLEKPCISGIKRDIVENPTAIPTFSG